MNISIPGHEAKIISKPVTAYGYGDTPYQSSESYFKCSCGFELELHETKNFPITRLEHYVVVLSGQWVDEREEYQRLREKYG